MDFTALTMGSRVGCGGTTLSLWQYPNLGDPPLSPALSYPSSLFCLSNLNVCVFHDCEKDFVGAISLL